MLKIQRIKMLRITKKNEWCANPCKSTEYQKQSHPPCDDLFLVARSTLVLGKFQGIFPFQGLLNMNSDSLPTFKKRSWSAALSLGMAIIFIAKGVLFLSIILNLGWNRNSGKQGSTDKLNHTICAVNLFCTGWLYWYFWSKGEKFCLIFSFWRDQCRQMNFIPQRDSNLKWKANVFLAVVMISAILENIFKSLRALPQFSELKEDEGNISITEIYYRDEIGALANILPYDNNIIVLLVIVMIHRMAVYGLNTIAVLMSIMAYALGQKFKYFVNEISDKLDKSTELSDSKPETVLKVIKIQDIRNTENSADIDWYSVRQDYMRLCQLVHKIDEFVSPLILWWVAFGVEWICITIYNALTPSKMTVLDQTYTIWAFIHLASRILILTLSANEIIEQSQKFQNILENCPKDEYCQEIERLERLVSRPAGFTGLRCFTLSRSFILSLVNVVFTIEIVMLQASGGNQPLHGTWP